MPLCEHKRQRSRCRECALAAPCGESSCSTSVPTLYDMPVSNNGARCRILIYKKNLTLGEDIVIRPPSDLGGLKSPEYLALNPQGKMPLLVTSHGNIPESDTIARYILDRFAPAVYVCVCLCVCVCVCVCSYIKYPITIYSFASAGPSLIPSTLEARAKSDLLCRLHDIYITSIQALGFRV
jgi:hypothetical protein